jgi:hypothetical protein
MGRKRVSAGGPPRELSDVVPSRFKNQSQGSYRLRETCSNHERQDLPSGAMRQRYRAGPPPIKLDLDDFEWVVADR